MASIRPDGLVFLLALLLSTLAGTVLAVTDKVYIKGTSIDGIERELDVSRYPSLYTRDFDDCLDGQSLFNITKFDAAYYADNSTVLFHLDGATNVRNEDLVLHIAVEAYGVNRFNLSYDPCKGADMQSLCPLNASVPISATAIIPVTLNDVASIPSVALNIPDLEGFAVLHIFANSTETEIGCFQAVMTNGQSFSQPHAVGTILGIFTAFAVLASFATATYGVSLPHMRTHYAHSFSVLVIFETFQAIFFSGGLSLNWPSVLPAWWSNFAWSAGMFSSTPMIYSILPFTGQYRNISQVGGAGWLPLYNRGGLARQIYGRSTEETTSNNNAASILDTLLEQAKYNSSDPYDYKWNGKPRTPGMPLPGTWPGFGGTLSALNLPVSEAFIMGLIWLAVILAAVAVFITLFKLTLELMAKMKWLKADGFDFFRSHWKGYMLVGMLRTLFIAFFVMMTLTLRQFVSSGPAGPTAIAAIIFVAFLFGLGGIATYTWMFRLRDGKFEVTQDKIQFERGFLWSKIPFVAATRASKIDPEEPAQQQPQLYGSAPFVQVNFLADNPNRPAVHSDESYVKRFGWLTARYRRTRWWFFIPYMIYQFVRACFIGAGATMPLAQVFGLFIFELLALPMMIKLSPYEANRNTVAALWMLSVSKIITTGLSIGFLPDLKLNRTVATALGMIIIVVQAFLAISVLVLIALGIASSWMSLSRNSENFPEKLERTRVTYFEHLDERSKDLVTVRRRLRPGSRIWAHTRSQTQAQPQPQQPAPAPTQSRWLPQSLSRRASTASQSSFSVGQVRRVSKMEEVGVDRFPQFEANGVASGPYAPGRSRSRAHSAGSRYSGGSTGGVSTSNRPRSRANSASSRFSNGSLHRNPRAQRTSWSSQDVRQWDAEMNKIERVESFSKSLPNKSLRFQPLAVPGMPPTSYAESSQRRSMTPARESLEDDALQSSTSNRPPSMIEEADEDKKNSGETQHRSTALQTEPQNMSSVQKGKQPETAHESKHEAEEKTHE